MLASVELLAIVDNAVDVAVFTGKYYGPAGGANGICAEAVVEAHAFFGNPVEIWCLVDFAAVTAHSV